MNGITGLDGRDALSVCFSCTKSDGVRRRKMCFLGLSGWSRCDFRMMTRIVSASYSIPIGYRRK